MQVVSNTPTTRVACRRTASDIPPLRVCALAPRRNAHTRHTAPCDASSCHARQSLLVARAAPTTGAAGSSIDTREPSVEEVMVPHPILFKESTPIKEAVRVMLEKDISGAPVVDDNGVLVGVLSESDVIWKGAGAPQDHFLIPPMYISIVDAFIFLRDNKQFEDEVHKILSKTVGEAMTRDALVSVAPSDPMSKAATIMLQKKVNRLPVVEGGKVVGVITRHDVLRGLYASHSPFL